MPINEQSDAELMTRLCTGDDSALDALMDRYRGPILNFVYRMLGNHADAEEIAQLVFVKAYQNRANYDPDHKFSTWLFALAHHATIDRLRWQARHPTTALNETTEPATTHTALTAAMHHDLGEQVAAAIDALPEDQRAAILLSEYHGFSASAISRTLGCSVKAVESRLYRGRQFLRGKLRHLLAEDR